MTDYEGMILARSDWFEILDDVGGAICCDDCTICVFKDVCDYCEEDEEDEDDN